MTLEETDKLYQKLNTDKPVYHPEELCDLLGINRTTLCLYIKYNLIGHRKLGKKFLVTFEELMEFLRKTEGMEISNTPDGIKAAAITLRGGMS